MRTTLKIDITVQEICEGFVYSELEGKGLFGLSGKPLFSRNISAITSMRLMGAKESKPLLNQF
jgi:hypothetical protein